MPRRREADDEDRMVACPRCRGRNTIYDVQAEAEVECPLCFGVGRVSQYVYQTYQTHQARP